MNLNTNFMKKIEAIIRLNKFDAVRDALAKIGVNFFTLEQVKGYGLQQGEKMVYRGSVYGAEYIARLQLNILTTSDKVNLLVDTIAKAARTGEVGDGKISVYEVEHVRRIRTGETNEAAI